MGVCWNKYGNRLKYGELDKTKKRSLIVYSMRQTKRLKISISLTITLTSAPSFKSKTYVIRQFSVRNG